MFKKLIFGLMVTLLLACSSNSSDEETIKENLMEIYSVPYEGFKVDDVFPKQFKEIMDEGVLDNYSLINTLSDMSVIATTKEYEVVVKEIILEDVGNEQYSYEVILLVNGSEDKATGSIRMNDGKITMMKLNVLPKYYLDEIKKH